MNLFKNRPMALVCALIIFVSFFSHKFLHLAKLMILFPALALLVVAAAVSLKSARYKVRAIFVCLCAIGVILATSVQIFAVDIRAERARSLEGERYCELLIIGERSDGALDTYDAKLCDVDGKRVSFDATLYLSFDSELEAGDVVRVSGTVSEADLSPGILYSESELYVLVYSPGACALVSEGNFSLEILFSTLRGRTVGYLGEIFGKECGALASGILLGDTDAISGDIIRDFRRAGVSHLLAVSGLHISMLVAMAELILRSLRIGKRARCVTLCVLSLVFLGMTGFEMSACRSVFMLLFVYLHYLFVRESDSVSALFAAVAVIMLISPEAANDVGLWLSFLATLGIISVFTPMSKYFRDSYSRGFWPGVLRMLKKLSSALLLCFICNVFTSIVVWMVFGEVSAVTLISNLFLTPISLLFLVAIPIGMIFAGFGGLGEIAVEILRVISRLIEHLCGVFSAIDGALISLGYGFAGVIIISMTVSIAVMLVIKMRRKWLILVPPIAAVAAFALCLSLHNAMGAGSIALTYRRQNSNEMIVMSQRYGAAVIDVSSGSYGFIKDAVELTKQSYATEICDFAVTHYHESHPTSLDLLMERMMLRRIHLPKPESEAEAMIAREIIYVAELHGCEVLMYESGDTLALFSDTRVRIDRKADREGAVAIFIANEGEALAYIGDGLRESEDRERFSSLADYMISGVHGGRSGDAQESAEDRIFILH